MKEMSAVLLMLALAGCNSVGAQGTLSSPSPSATPTSTESQRVQDIQQRVASVVAAIEDFHSKFGGYPRDLSQIALNEIPQDIAYKRLDDADAYRLEEWLGSSNGSPIVGCVYESQMKKWTCPE